MTYKTYKKESGLVALLIVIAAMLAASTLALSSAFVFLNRAKAQKNIALSYRSFYSQEAGMEDALYRVTKNKQYLPSYSVTLNNSLVNLTISGGDTKTVIARSDQQNVFRSAATIITANTTEANFFYGVQVGEGGVRMGNNSRIQGAGGALGNFYSNGPIKGDSGAVITGNVTVATGGASESSIDDVIVYGTARANTIKNSSICGDAYYQATSTIDSDSKNFLDNPTNPTCGGNPLTPGAGFPGQPDPPVAQMPISDSDINQWKADAQAGGTHIGNFSVTSNTSLGPREITGNLLMTTNNRTLTVTGALYVRGNIDISGNGSTIQCDPSFGATSCVVVADGWMHVVNNVTFRGSGQAGSYILLLTTLAGCNGEGGTGCTHHDSAIDLHNNALGAIFYAARSKINLHNGVNASELVARKLVLDNNAVVTYETGLANAEFQGGPGASWTASSWREVE